jgi:ATP-dependent DNA helicase RecQ
VAIEEPSRLQTASGERGQWPLLRRASLAIADTVSVDLDQARTILREVFGHEDFRGLQGDVIGEVLAGRNAVAVLPTGGGKSLCFQIPALAREGVALVVSPP